jgi:Tol biopolymer transport system component
LPKTRPGDIAFVRSDHIWRVRTDGSDPVQVSRGAGSDFSPAWSPDHARIAFVHVAEPGMGPSTLCMVPASGGPVRSWRFADLVLGLSFSPDGRRIAFADLRLAGRSTEQVVVLDIATGRHEVVRTLHDNFTTSMTVSWSPDGRRVLLAVGRQDGEGQRAGVLTLASGRLVWLPTRDASEAHWSGRGDAIVVSQGTQAYTQVAIADADGAGTRVLVRGGGSGSGRPNVWGGCFSPSGSRIAYCKDRAIWTIGVDGKHARRLVANGSQPAWAPR